MMRHESADRFSDVEIQRFAKTELRVNAAFFQLLQIDDRPMFDISQHQGGCVWTYDAPVRPRRQAQTRLAELLIDIVSAVVEFIAAALAFAEHSTFFFL